MLRYALIKLFYKFYVMYIMKKLLTLFAVLFIGTMLYGQIRDAAFIELRDLYVERSKDPNDNICPTTIEEVVHEIGFYNENGEIWLDYWYVYFINNDIVYLLSYEIVKMPFMGGKRDIYLYYKKIDKPLDPWMVASKEVNIKNEVVDCPVLTCEYYMTNGGETSTDVDFFFYDKDEHNTSVGKVVQKDNGVVEMTVGVVQMIDGRGARYDNGKRKGTAPHTFVFTPMGNGIYYSVKRKFHD